MSAAFAYAGRMLTPAKPALETATNAEMLFFPGGEAEEIIVGAFNRVVSRLANLSVGGKSVIRSAEAFASRAGSTFRGRGPTASSDLDVLLEVDLSLIEGRSKAWVAKALDNIASDFEKATGIKLSLTSTTTAEAAKASLRDTPFVALIKR